jgi:tetratricopeptide (TPR) repeat protein
VALRTKRGRLLPSKDLFFAQCLHQLAWVLHVQGRHAEAEMVSREALGIRHQFQGTNHPDVALNLSFLGLFLRAQGKLPEAEPVLREALSIRRDRLGIGHFETLHSLRAITDLLSVMNRGAEASQLLRDELDACRKAHGADHAATRFRWETFILAGDPKHETRSCLHGNRIVFVMGGESTISMKGHKP